MNEINKTPYILSEDFVEPIYIGGYYEVIEEAVDDLKGTTSTIRKKMKIKIEQLMKNCNKKAGRSIYIGRV